jgi:predicted amidohydrolase
MTLVKVALLQLAPTGTPEGNLEKGLMALRAAKKNGADLALFPEMWQVGYEPEWMQKRHAISLEAEFIIAFKDEARDLGLAIAITYLGFGKKRPTNNLAIIDATGDIILDYAKVCICDFEGGLERGLEPGTEFKVATLHTIAGAVEVGAMICLDREFPESARALAIKGAELIVTANAGSLYSDPIVRDVRLQQFRSRAFENMVGVAIANYPRPKQDGHSAAFNVDGCPLVIADEAEGIFFATFNIDAIRAWRCNEPWRPLPDSI